MDSISTDNTSTADAPATIVRSATNVDIAVTLNGASTPASNVEPMECNDDMLENISP